MKLSGRSIRRGRNLPRLASAVTALSVLSVAFALTACGGLLDVDLPGETLEEDLSDPNLMPPLVAGAIADFECAFSIYTSVSALFSGVFKAANTRGTMIPYNRRLVLPSDLAFSIGECGTLEGVGLYTPLSRARFAAEDTRRRLEAFSDDEVANRASLMATMDAYAGYAYVVFGEGFCSAAFDLGPEQTPQQIFGLAEERFTRAIDLAAATGNTDILNMARLGRARALLNLGRGSDAVADAREVPDGFAVYATYDLEPLRRANKVYHVNARERWVSVEPAFRNLTFEGVEDPRVPVRDLNVLGADGLTPIWLQEKYLSASARAPIARSAEAKLIIAEVEGGQTAVDIINELHQQAGLPAFGSTDPDEIAAHVIQERQRELFLESHYMGDLRRLGQPFPTGDHPYQPLRYSGQDCFPLPNVERDANPNI